MNSTRFQARHVDLSKGYCLIVTAHSHAQITFGLDRIETQISRLHRYLTRAAEDQMEIQTVNLIVERNTPVTFVEPPAVEAATWSRNDPDCTVRDAGRQGIAEMYRGAGRSGCRWPLGEWIRSERERTGRWSCRSVAGRR